MKRAVLLPDPIRVGGSRLVVHIQTSPKAVDDFLTLLRNMAKEKNVILPSGVTENNKSNTTPEGNGSSTNYRNVYVRIMDKPDV